MPDVKIKGYSGAELEYKDVPKVYLAAPESTPDNPVLVPFTYGEAVESVEVEADFSDGDMQISAPDGYLVKSAVIKKPETLKPENIAKDVEIAGITGTHEGGGSADLRYVTFMDDTGTVEYGKKAVAVGDDCADPIARGIFGTPTKESTAQYNYTFSGGWATVPNGGINANALKGVTDDRTVYANFIGALREYTITFKDDDGSILKQQTYVYGSTPVYTPDKEGFSFIAWNPAITAVTGNASYTAQWKARTGLQFVSKATGVVSGLGGYALNSTLEVTNSGKKVVAAKLNTEYTDIPVYNMTTPEATTEYIHMTSARYLQYAVLDNTDSKLLSYRREGTSSHYFDAIGFDGNVTSSGAGGAVDAISYSPDSNFAVYERAIKYGDYVLDGYGRSTAEIASLGAFHTYYIKVTKNDEYVVCVNRDTGEIRVYRIADCALMSTISTKRTYALNRLTVSPDGKRFAIAWSNAPYVTVYSLETFEQLCDFSGIITASSHAAFVGDILVVATGTAVRAFTIENGVPGEYFDIPAYSGGSVSRIARSLNGNHIAFYDGSNIELWSKV